MCSLASIHRKVSDIHQGLWGGWKFSIFHALWVLILWLTIWSQLDVQYFQVLKKKETNKCCYLHCWRQSSHKYIYQYTENLPVFSVTWMFCWTFYVILGIHFRNLVEYRTDYVIPKSTTQTIIPSSARAPFWCLGSNGRLTIFYEWAILLQPSLSFLVASNVAKMINSRWKTSFSCLTEIHTPTP